MIKFEDFQKIDLRVGEIIKVEEIENSEKLLKLIVDLGKEKRQIVAGIKKEYKKEELLGKKIVIVANLESKKLMGIESQGMLLAVDVEGKPVLIIPEKDVPSGSKVK